MFPWLNRVNGWDERSVSTTHLQQACTRLEEAIKRLEAASGHVLKPGGGHRGEQGANGGLIDMDEVKAVRARCEALEERSRDVSDQLDAAINRMKTVLDS